MACAVVLTLMMRKKMFLSVSSVSSERGRELVEVMGIPTFNNHSRSQESKWRWKLLACLDASIKFYFCDVSINKCIQLGRDTRTTSVAGFPRNTNLVSIPASCAHLHALKKNMQSIYVDSEGWTFQKILMERQPFVVSTTITGLNATVALFRGTVACIYSNPWTLKKHVIFSFIFKHQPTFIFVKSRHVTLWTLELRCLILHANLAG